MPSGLGLSDTTVLTVAEASQVGEARRQAAAAARDLGFDETAAGRVSLVATEAASNVVRHGGGGQILWRPLLQAGSAGLELLALDRGRGIPDLEQAWRDGHSTGGTPGTGLGAIRRLSSTCDVYTRVGGGTALLARLWAGRPPSVDPPWGAVCIPKPGEDESGDAYLLESFGERVRVAVVDGLGHGPLAREAALHVLEALRGRAGSPGAAVEDAHRAARVTRGAALAVAEVDPAAGEVRYAGMGNIAGVLASAEGTRSMVSMNGTVGQGLVRAREFTYDLGSRTLIIMTSDGLASRWSLDPYPGLLERHPALVAGVLYRDHARGRDDATVVVLRAGDWR
jgi:anti-sigma regulatory factor (Ser/Thr protein kinase)